MMMTTMMMMTFFTTKSQTKSRCATQWNALKRRLWRYHKRKKHMGRPLRVMLLWLLKSHNRYFHVCQTYYELLCVCLFDCFYIRSSFTIY